MRLVRNDHALASVRVTPAEHLDLAGRTPQQLRGSVVLGDLAAAPSALRPVLAYLGLRRARIWGRRTVACVAPDDPQVRLLDLEASGGLYAQRLDLAMHRAFTACDPGQRALCGRHMLDEALAVLARHARGFADTAWARAVRARRLGRAQYVATLASTHQYVRYTPRLLARAIAFSPDEELREHFLRHLGGERRHDRLLEADLRHLGADVEYVRDMSYTGRYCSNSRFYVPSDRPKFDLELVRFWFDFRAPRSRCSPTRKHATPGLAPPATS